MKISNLSPRQIKNKIDKELKKDSRYNGNMSKIKEKTATTKDILLGFVNEQRKFNDQQREFNTRIESKVKQAHPELFDK